MSKCFITTASLLVFISISIFYFLVTNNLVPNLKTRDLSQFYQLVRDSSQMQINRYLDEAERAGKPLIPPFINFDREYSIAPRYNLSVCRIKKSMSTLMSGITCLLFNTEQFLKHNQSILAVWSQRFCGERNEFRRLSEIKWTMGAARNSFTRLAVVRHPISRFISFFSNKCIFEAQKFPQRRQCYDCQGNVTCFLIKQYQRFLKHSRGDLNLRPSYEDKHAAPLSWNCEFHKYLKDYKIVKLSVARESRGEGLTEILNILKSNNVPNETLEYIKKSALEGETRHATFDSEAHDDVKRQVKTDSVIRDYLRRIYFFDFIIFNFDSSELSST